MKKFWLDNKTFVITGASSGLGRGIAKLLILKHGCKVIGIGRSENKFSSLKEELGNRADLLEVKLFDVTQKENWQTLALDIETSGKSIDGLINCAGILPKFKRALTITENELETAINTDFLSCVYAINALYPILSRSSAPAIINVSSSAALATIVGTAAYSAAKSALKSYTEALIYELKGKAYVSIVMPGFARTDIFRSQNSTIDENKLFVMMSMPADKMVNKIYRGILKKKTRMVFGKDAHAMSICYRIAPKTTMYIISKILKKANVKLFEDVFNG